MRPSSATASHDCTDKRHACFSYARGGLRRSGFLRSRPRTATWRKAGKNDAVGQARSWSRHWTGPLGPGARGTWRIRGPRMDKNHHDRPECNCDRHAAPAENAARTTPAQGSKCPEVFPRQIEKTAMSRENRIPLRASRHGKATDQSRARECRCVRSALGMARSAVAQKATGSDYCCCSRIPEIGTSST